MEVVKGFRDITGEEAIKREKIREILVRTFELYGFEPAETPIIEQESFVKGQNNDEAVSDIFKLKDKGKRNLALRYEFTFQLKRLTQNKKLPFRRYQIGPVFRDEPTSGNRFRQFTQCDADIVSSTIKEEAEILDLTTRVLGDLGIDAVIYINNRKLLNEILDKLKVPQKDRDAVIKEIDKLDKIPEKEVKENLKKYKAGKILTIFKEKGSYFKKFKAYSEIEELMNYCNVYGLSIQFQPSLARGLSYYNGSVFEVKAAGMKETIVAGGSYLVNELQSTGISFGLDRLSQISKLRTSKSGVLLISIGQDNPSILLAEKLRSKGIPVNIWLGKGISKALEYGNSLNIPYSIFLGEEEIKQGKVKLRDMKTGKENLITEDKLIKILKG